MHLCTCYLALITLHTKQTDFDLLDADLAAHVLGNDGYHLNPSHIPQRIPAELSVTHCTPSIVLRGKSSYFPRRTGLHCPLHLPQHELRHVRQRTFALCGYFYLLHFLLSVLLKELCLSSVCFSHFLQRVHLEYSWRLYVARVVVNVIKSEPAAVGSGALDLSTDN